MTSPDSTPASRRFALPLDPRGILLRASRMGRVLVGVRAPGALLERIGPLDPVAERADGWLVSENASGYTAIDPTAVASIVTDVSETPHDTLLTYVDFLDADGASIVKVTALDGPELLEAALEGLPRAPLPYVPPLPRTTIPVDQSDPGALPFHGAVASGEAVTLVAVRPGAEQSHTGVVEAVRLGHSYVNLIQSDMHLHLSAGAVAAWRRKAEGTRVTLAAEDAEGRSIGLTVSGPATAFADARIPA
ncbi:hypothetical protein OSH08_21365 [Kaistia geumhonensis]|uniref:Heme degradation protein n=1 Tax=Kaistia geumhonensis TaxID=410839 RepID=A0ABU0MCG2_9HYPH|nr:hypothetical protein [Kaistia geumhonensis]MCX5481562.1 hypothetical protein [Kaistia geumhonensis]MDQ0518628.1 putative heme degradation protein [Kaistia geumhonensis]